MVEVIADRVSMGSLSLLFLDYIPVARLEILDILLAEHGSHKFRKDEFTIVDWEGSNTHLPNDIELFLAHDIGRRNGCTRHFRVLKASVWQREEKYWFWELVCC